MFRMLFMLTGFCAFKSGTDYQFSATDKASYVQVLFPFSTFTYSTVGCMFHRIPSIRIFLLFALEMGTFLQLSTRP